MKSNSPALESGQGFDCFYQQSTVEETVCDFPGNVVIGHALSALSAGPLPCRMSTYPKVPCYMEVKLHGEAREALWSAALVFRLIPAQHQMRK